MKRHAGLSGAATAGLGILGLASGCLAQGPGPGLPAATETTSLLWATAKVFGALLVVVGLMLVVLYLIKRTGLLGAGSSRGGTIGVLETRLIAPKKYIAVVEVAGRCLALGITDHSINLLADLGAEGRSTVLDRNRRAKPTASFAALFDKSLQAQEAAGTADGATENTPCANQEQS